MGLLYARKSRLAFTENLSKLEGILDLVPGRFNRECTGLEVISSSEYPEQDLLVSEHDWKINFRKQIGYSEDR